LPANGSCRWNFIFLVISNERYFKTTYSLLLNS
jgi:hypothetical protein